MSMKITSSILPVGIIAGILLGPALARAGEPDEITRRIGLELLRERMIEWRADQARSINWEPPGYFLVGYPVRVG